MRISYCSSDVCSSYLDVPQNDGEPDLRHEPLTKWYFLLPGSPDQDSACHLLASKAVSTSSAASASTAHRRCPSESYQRLAFHDTKPMAFLHRSEEHTSELQSLMRISYAGFCLQKKKHNYSN